MRDRELNISTNEIKIYNGAPMLLLSTPPAILLRTQCAVMCGVNAPIAGGKIYHMHTCVSDQLNLYQPPPYRAYPTPTAPSPLASLSPHFLPLRCLCNSPCLLLRSGIKMFTFDVVWFSTMGVV